MKALILLPLHNEESTVGDVLCAVQEHAPAGADVLVIDDGSTDRSAAIVGKLPHVTVVTHERQQGYGASLIHGFRLALERDYEAVATLDCDDQHEPHLLPVLFTELADVDIVSGSRYLSLEMPGDEAPPERRQINQTITALINELTGLGITDAFCGFKAYRAEALRHLSPDESSYGMPLQVWIQAARAGLRIKELPISCIYRSLERRFSEGLDDPQARLRYYLGVIEREVQRWRRPLSS